jgi:uncharacterized membrane protein YeiH
VAGNAGGVMRDVLIGSVPPAAISDWRYGAASLVAGITTFVWYANVKRLQHVVLLFDAMGLGIFAVSGAQKALDCGVNPFAAALLGMLTGIGGGIVRDLLVKEIPVVLRTDVYAIAALPARRSVAGHLLTGRQSLPRSAARCCVSSCASSRYDAVGLFLSPSCPAGREVEVAVEQMARRARHDPVRLFAAHDTTGREADGVTR